MGPVTRCRLSSACLVSISPSLYHSPLLESQRYCARLCTRAWLNYARSSQASKSQKLCSLSVDARCCALCQGEPRCKAAYANVVNRPEAAKIWLHLRSPTVAFTVVSVLAVVLVLRIVLSKAAAESEENKEASLLGRMPLPPGCFPYCPPYCYDRFPSL